MGICAPVSRSSFSSPPPALPNPDPRNFKFVSSLQIGQFLVIEIEYPDCTNYEGRKVMVFHSTIQDLLRQGAIDPHFSDNAEKISPLARFEPTLRGREWAMMFAEQLSKTSASILPRESE